MPRSRIEIYWKKIETAPAGVAVQVRVTDGSDHDYLLPYPCKLMEGTWVNAASGTPLAVRPTYWKLYVETLPGKKAWKRRPPAELCLLAIALWGCLFWPEREPVARTGQSRGGTGRTEQHQQIKARDGGLDSPK